MDDDVYNSVLRKFLLDDKCKFHLENILRFKDTEVAQDIFDKFERSQMSNLIEILKGISKEDIDNFLIKELKRLKLQSAKVVDLSSIDSASTTLGAEIINFKERRQHVDLLLKKDKQGDKIRLDQNIFSLLIREYRDCVELNFPQRDVAFLPKEAQAEIKKLLYRAKTVGAIIHKNKDSLGWMSSLRLDRNPEMVVDLVKFMYNSLHFQDAQAWETLIEKLGDNFKNLIKIIPQTKSDEGLKSSNLITIKSMNSIIKRIILKTKNIEQWNKIQRIFNDAIGLEGHLGVLSVSAPSEARSSASLVRRFAGDSPAGRLAGDSPARRLDDSSAQRLGDFSQNVAKSGPVAGARGDGARGA